MTNTPQVRQILTSLQFDETRPTWSSFLLERAISQLPLDSASGLFATLEQCYSMLEDNELSTERAALVRDFVVGVFSNSRDVYSGLDFAWLNERVLAGAPAKAQAYFASLIAMPGSLSAQAIFRLIEATKDSFIDEQVRSQLSDEFERPEVAKIMAQKRDA